MSDRTASVAVDAMLAIDMSDEDFGWEMITLAEAVDFDYERWCRIMGFDPDDPVIEAKWARLTWRWAELWNEVGTKTFIARTKDRVNTWRRMVSSKVP